MGQVSSSPIALYTGVAILALALYKVYDIFFRKTYISDLPGPDKPHIFWGHQDLVWNHDPGVMHERWAKQYGHVLRFNHLGNVTRLQTTDLRAMAHVLQHTEVYHKPWRTQKHLGDSLGYGLLVSEGEKHRIQRKALNPAFGPSPVRELTAIMIDKANELRDALSSQVSASPSGTVQVEMLAWLSGTTLDIIGLAGFGYDFNAIASESSHGEGAGEQNELLSAFQTIFGAATQRSLIHAFTLLFPMLRLLPTARNLKLKHAMATMRQIGIQLLDERKAAALAGAAQGEKLADARARDLLSLLVRANTTASDKERLSDEDVLSQIPTFLVAGHETTSSLMSWIFFRLALHPEVATALREECRSNPLPKDAHGNAPLTSDELNAMDRLPILDAVIRETLRLHSPVAQTVRCAVKDDILPLSKPFVDRQGEVQDHIRITTGDDVVIPILLINRSTDLWGADAHEWNPRRWMNGTVPENVKSVPGVWGNVLSFLGGSHACIGYKFSLFETKIILHALSSEFTFQLAVPRADIGAKAGIVIRPIVNSRKHEGAQLPVILRRAED